MAANTSPIFTLTPNCATATIDSANITRDGSGVLITLFTAGANGSLISRIVFTSSQATAGASVLKVCRIFVTDSAGANPKLRGEILLPGLSPSNTVIGATATFTFTDSLVIKAGQIVKVSQSLRATAADNTDVIAEGGDY